MRLAEWPRMPFLNEELCGWINEHLGTLGLDELAMYALEEGRDDDARRVLVATEIGLVDYHYGPRASTARFAIAGRVYPWQAVRGVDLRVETFRLWALEHQTRWSLTIARPAFRAGTEDAQLGRALADFAKVAVIMAEPSGWAPPDEDVEAAPQAEATPRAEAAPDAARAAASLGVHGAASTPGSRVALGSAAHGPAAPGSPPEPGSHPQPGSFPEPASRSEHDPAPFPRLLRRPERPVDR